MSKELEEYLKAVRDRCNTTHNTTPENTHTKADVEALLEMLTYTIKFNEKAFKLMGGKFSFKQLESLIPKEGE